MRHCFWILAFLLGLFTTAPAQVRYYADAATGNDTYDGLSVSVGAFPQGPKLTVQAAVDAAATADTIMLAPGAYAETVTVNTKDVIFNSTGTATVTKFIFTGGANPRLRLVVNYVPLSINSTFATNSNWTFGTGWSYNAATQAADRASASAATGLTSTSSLTAGATYRLGYSWTRSSFLGGVVPFIGGTQGTTRTSDITVSGEEIQAGNSLALSFVNVNQGIFVTGSIDNVSLELKQFTAPNIKASAIDLNGGDGIDVREALRMLDTGGKLQLGAGTYTLTEPLTLTRSCIFIGQDTLTPANAANRVVLNSMGVRNMLVVGASNVLIKGLEIRVRSNGLTTVGTTNSESVGITISSGLLSNVRIQNNHIKSLNTSTGSLNGVGIKSVQVNGLLTIRNNLITNTDTNSIPNSSFFTKGIWGEICQGTVSGNSIYFSTSQDIILRFTNGPIKLYSNRILGYGMELNTVNQTVEVAYGYFRQPFGQPAVAYGGLIAKGGSTQLITIRNSLFEGYSTPAVQVYGQPSIILRGNTFTAPTTGGFTHAAFYTCQNQGTCTIFGSVTATIDSNRFTDGAVGQGTAIDIRRDNTANIYNSLTIGQAGKENRFEQDLNRLIWLDSTSTRPVSNVLNLTNNRYEFNGTFTPPASLSKNQLVSIEDKIQHGMDAATLGFATLKTNTAVLSGMLNNRYPQRAITSITSGGTVVAKPATVGIYPAVTLNKASNWQVAGDTLKMVSLTQSVGSSAIAGSVALRDALTLQTGTLAVDSGEVRLDASGATALQACGSCAVQGLLSRRVVAGNTYAWPITAGAAAGYPTRVQVVSVTGQLSYLSGQVINQDPASHPLPSTVQPFTENGVTFTMLSDTRYVQMVANRGSALYHLRIKQPDIMPAADGYTLLKRPEAGTVFGKDGIARLPAPVGTWQWADSTLRRDSLTGFSSFAVGTGTVNPVPLHLLRFEVRCQDGICRAVWQEAIGSTATQLRLKRVDNEAKMIFTDWLESSRPKAQTTEFRQPEQSGLVYLQAITAEGALEQYGPLSVPGSQHLSETTLTLWPNPAQGQVFIFNGASQVYQVVGADGRIIRTGKLNKGMLTVEGMAPGLYELRLPELGRTFRFVKE